MNPAILRYFDCGHLPQHLQDIVAPFRACAHLSAECHNLGDIRALDAIDKLAASNTSNCPDPVESRHALSKILEAFAAPSLEARLRLLLEAKDCAVRAMIPVTT
mgnify:CR=1 FL=1